MQDLKSPNVLLSEEGVAKIADVGMSRRQEAALVSAQPIMTPLWAAPEVSVVIDYAWHACPSISSSSCIARDRAVHARQTLVWYVYLELLPPRGQTSALLGSGTNHPLCIEAKANAFSKLTGYALPNLVSSCHCPIVAYHTFHVFKPLVSVPHTYRWSLSNQLVSNVTFGHSVC